MHFTGKDLS